MYFSKMNHTSVAALVATIALCMYTDPVSADSVQIIFPEPHTTYTAGDHVALKYHVQQSDLAKLVWAKVHLMTNQGQIVDDGAIHTAVRDEWKDDHDVSVSYTLPASLPSGQYIFHVFGNTDEPCNTNQEQRCQGVLSDMIPIDIQAVVAKDNTNNKLRPINVSINLHKNKRSLYPGRDLALIPRPQSSSLFPADYNNDPKKMLYMLSLI